jgi:hypothetical protein
VVLLPRRLELVNVTVSDSPGLLYRENNTQSEPSPSPSVLARFELSCGRSLPRVKAPGKFGYCSDRQQPVRGRVTAYVGLLSGDYSSPPDKIVFSARTPPTLGRHGFYCF